MGDNVEIAVLDEEHKKGNIEKVLPRENGVIRPAVANIDLALIIFAAAKPQPNFNLLDRFLVMMEYQNVPVAICFNKTDLVTEEELHAFADIYAACGYRSTLCQCKRGKGCGRAVRTFERKNSGGGRTIGSWQIFSSVNRLQPNITMQTGEVSRKIERGRHTTRHSEIIPIGGDTYIMDTPGFSTLYIPGMEKEDLKGFYPEFRKWEPYCRFQGCNHISEPDCGVRQGLEEGSISLPAV